MADNRIRGPMSLSSLIVQRGVATMRQVEEALARQVIYGGDLVTNILEVVRIDESTLTLLLADATGLAAAPAGELPRPPDRIRALVPPEMAAKRAMVPIEARGNTLVLAVAERLPREIEEELAFSLGMGIEQRIAPSVRVRESIAGAYGGSLERRVQRLLARLSGKSEASGSMPPPLGSAPEVPEPPRPPSAPPPRGLRSANPPLVPPAHTAVGAASSVAHARRKTSTSFPAVRPSSAPRAAPEASVPKETPAAPEAASMPARAPADPHAALLQRDVTPSMRPTRRRRGPITREQAAREAEEAADRDALLELFFDYSRQFFEYAALFLVHGDIAEGRDAFGSGASRERVLGIGIPLDLPSLVATARDKKETVVARAAPDSLDAVLLADLQRARDAEIAIVPLIVRGRPVAVLLGDCGDAGIDPSHLRPIEAFGEVVAKAFERIIVRRKLAGFVAGSREASVGRVESSAVVPKQRAASVAPASAAVAPAPAAVLSAATHAAFSSVSAVPPPPAANISVVRKISGPPIPREEPASPTFLRVARAEAVTEPPPPKAAPSPPAPVVTVQDEAEESAALFDELGWEGATPDEAAPPVSSAIVVPPHRPPTSQRMSTDVLPSVIVATDPELEPIVDRVIAGQADEAAEGELLQHGERAMHVIMSRFPGPVRFDRARIATAIAPPRASECGPVLRLVAHQRRVALPFVLSRLGDTDAEVRGWATHLLVELPYAEAVPHLVARLQDVDASTRASAALALVAVARTSRDAVRDASVPLLKSREPELRAAVLGILAELRAPGLVTELVHALGDANGRVVAAAHDALVKTTAQDFGEDARRWLQWWEANGRRHRLEWLIDALTHEVTEIRRAAGEELRASSREYFGYASDLPARDRERAQQRYRDWWITEGRARFPPA